MNPVATSPQPRPGTLTGCGTALVTPFLHDGRVDEASLRALVDWQIAEGVDFLVPCGSTGEAATLSLDEHRRVVEVTVDQAAGRVPIVAGAGSNDTRKAITLSREAAAGGATHLLHVTPMYSKPPQRSLLAHFRAVADACDAPIILYNVPSRTAVNLEADTCLELAADTRFAGVKEASGNVAQIAAVIRHRPAGFSVLSGDDGLTLSVMAHGGDGVISVVSNIVPRLIASLVRACAAGDFADARRLDARMAPIVHAAFIESNPIPAKAMLSILGRVQNIVRLPLTTLHESHLPLVHAALVASGARD